MFEGDISVIVICGSIIIVLILRKLFQARRRMKKYGESFADALKRPKPIRNKVDLSGNKPTPEARRKTNRLKKKYRPEADKEPWEDGMD